MIEFQYQPADIRRKVRYLFLRTRTVYAISIGILAPIALYGVGIYHLPSSVESLLVAYNSHRLEKENETLNKSIHTELASLEMLERKVEQNRAIGWQLALALGAPGQASYAGGTNSQPASTVETIDMRAERRALELERSIAALLLSANDLTSFFSSHEVLSQRVPSICPLPEGTFVLSSPFGDRSSPFTGEERMHAGLDLAAREGTPVLAPGDGQVTFSGRVPLTKNVGWWRMGNIVILDHAGAFVTVFGHMRDFTVRAGQVIHRGDPIGTVGNSGWSTSPHLHYEVRRTVSNGGIAMPMDPRIFILNHVWKDQEALLVASRRAPNPSYDPLPSIVDMR